MRYAPSLEVPSVQVSSAGPTTLLVSRAKGDLSAVHAELPLELDAVCAPPYGLGLRVRPKP